MIAGASDCERIQAAIVLWAHGNLGRLRDALKLATADWRGELVRGGRADGDWPQRLDAELGQPASRADGALALMWELIHAQVRQSRWPWPELPVQCRMGHVWKPGTVTIDWRPCECETAATARRPH